MLRTDREVTDIGEIIKLINLCKVCHIAMVDDGKPYVVPLNFGYTYENGELVLYFHSAFRGRKIDILKKNPNVFFVMDTDGQLISADIPCKYGYKFSSLMGEGTMELIEEKSLKIPGLKIIMKHMTGKDFEIEEKGLGGVTILKLKAKNISCKARKA